MFSRNRPSSSSVKPPGCAWIQDSPCGRRQPVELQALDRDRDRHVFGIEVPHPLHLAAAADGERGVDESRMQFDLLQFLARGGDVNLPHGRHPRAPSRAEPAEGRAQRVAVPAEVLVELRACDGAIPGPRDFVEGHRRRRPRRLQRAQHAGGMRDPVGVPAGSHHHLRAAQHHVVGIRIAWPQADVQVARVVILQHHRTGEPHVLDAAGIRPAELAPGRQHHGQVGGRRHHHGLEQPVIVHIGGRRGADALVELDLPRLRRARHRAE